jgi:hypothetical protein
MSDILEITAIPAELVTVDFELNTWTLEVTEKIRVSAGRYVIFSEKDFNELLNNVNKKIFYLIPGQ